MTKKIAVIGYGAVGAYVLDALRGADGVAVIGVIARAGRLDAAQAVVAGRAPVALEVADLAERPDLVLDCAGHPGLIQHGARTLEAGIEMITVSSGALADPELFDRLTAASNSGGARLQVASGAIGGLDVLAAAKRGGLDKVVYQGRKPPKSWRGSPAEEAVDLDALSEAAVFFEADAREAALRYPKNANVAASAALAGLGFERTTVKLIADPAATHNTHELEVEGAFGGFAMRLQGAPMPGNPRSSALTAMSMVDAALRRVAPIWVG